MDYYEKLMKYSFFLLSKRRYTTFEIKQKLDKYFEKNHSKWLELAKEKEKDLGETVLENKKISGEIDFKDEEVKNSYKEKIIKKTINRLLELKYLDDFNFAKDYISNCLELRPRGKFLLIRELKNKGIEEDIISDNLQQFNIDEFEIALNLLEKYKHKWHGNKSKSPQKQKEKAFRFLASKGLPPDAIINAVKEYEL